MIPLTVRRSRGVIQQRAMKKVVFKPIFFFSFTMITCRLCGAGLWEPAHFAAKHSRLNIEQQPFNI